MHEKLKFEQIKKDSCASLRYDYSSLYPKDEMPLHFHPEIEICYVVKGSGIPDDRAQFSGADSRREKSYWSRPPITLLVI